MAKFLCVLYAHEHKYFYSAMKVIPLHKINLKAKTGQECEALGKEFEKADNPEAAIAAYKEMLKKDYNKELAYHRLMILFRKTGQPEKELAIITTAINDFRKIFSKRRVAASKTIVTISKKLTKSLGLLDKKGEAIYYPQPVQGWIKRKELILRRMKNKVK